MSNSLKIGLFGTGLDSYWLQFEGLKDHLNAYLKRIEQKMENNSGQQILNIGIIDNPDIALQGASLFLKENIDVVFVYVATYSLSSTILPIIQRLKCTVIILNLQPTPAIDYAHINGMDDRGKMTAYWLEHCQACSIPEIANVLNRSGLKYEIVTGYLEDKNTWREIKEWTAAAKVKKSMMNNRLGILGHYYGGMLDVYTDITQQSAVFGTHMELVEMCEIKKYRDDVTENELNAKIKEFHESFDIVPECEESEIIRAAKTSIGLDKLIQNHRLGSLAYYFEGSDDKDYEEIATSVITGNTLLTSRGIPIAGECEIKNAQAMKILSELGAGGSFAEFYAMDFNEDIILLGHDGPAHFSIAENNAKLVPLPVYHGKPGKGLSIQMSVKHGDVTLLSVCESKNGIFLLVAEGRSVPGPVLNIGNTNSRYKFNIGAKDFINSWSKAGPSHHCAIGIGHVAGSIEKLAFMLNIPCVKIC